MDKCHTALHLLVSFLRQWAIGVMSIGRHDIVPTVTALHRHGIMRLIANRWVV